ncbi:hypothetical protein IWQ49_006472 [Labrenzia sp. EL_126]|nr:hypothetical protein [Labrenzia sp. EL_126]
MADPIRPSVEDRVTYGTKSQIVSHNEYGRDVCGWKF